MTYGDFSKIWEDIKRKKIGKLFVYFLLIMTLGIGAAIVKKSKELKSENSKPQDISSKKDDNAPKDKPPSYKNKSGEKQALAPKHTNSKTEVKARAYEKPGNASMHDVNDELTSFFDSISMAIAEHDWLRVRQSFHPLFRGASASGGFDRDKEIDMIKAASDVRLKYLGIEKMNEDNSLLVKVRTNIRGDQKTDIYRLVKEEGAWMLRERTRG